VTAEFDRDGQRFRALNGGPQYSFSKLDLGAMRGAADGVPAA
jgi:hypothetical protein